MGSTNKNSKKMSTMWSGVVNKRNETWSTKSSLFIERDDEI